MKLSTQRRRAFLATAQARRPWWAWVLLMRVAAPLTVWTALTSAAQQAPQPLAAVLHLVNMMCGYAWLRIIWETPVDLWKAPGE